MIAGEREELKIINEEAVQIGASINLLSTLSWSYDTENKFLKSWESKNPKLPEPVYLKQDYSSQTVHLKKLLAKLTLNSPQEIFTKRSIESYLYSIEMINAIETFELHNVCNRVYGEPSKTIPGSTLTSLSAANRLLEITDKFSHPFLAEPSICVSAEFVRDSLTAKAMDTFGALAPVVTIEQNLSAKATASESKVRLRSGTCYTQYDPDQLYVHEVMTHSLTAINGSHQSILKTLSKGGPRTTKTQEGLATFAELITGTMDLLRLKRLALRVLAVDQAIKGADFIETFKFFLNRGHSEKESFWAAARIFRGSNLNSKKPGIFTKDVVYLEGLIRVAALFRWAMMNDRMGIIHLLFCGRLTIEDTFLLEQSLEEGIVTQPKYFPPWYEKIEGLAGTLAFSILSDAFHLDDVEDYYTKGDLN